VPRIRSIKPSFFASEDVAELPYRARLTWVGLWTHCDDKGRCKDNTKLIKAALWALDDVSLRDVEEDLAVLAEYGRITRYEVDGKRYLQVTNWNHQRIDKPTPSVIPSPAENAPRTLHEQLRIDPVRKGGEGKGGDARGAVPPSRCLDAHRSHRRPPVRILWRCTTSPRRMEARTDQPADHFRAALDAWRSPLPGGRPRRRTADQLPPVCFRAKGLCLMSDTELCVVVGCQRRQEHDLDCPDPEACTCMAPRERSADLLVCPYHHADTARLLGLLPELDDALAIALKPYRSPQAPKPAGSPAFERPDGVSSNATAARQRLAKSLRDAVLDLAIQRNFHLPTSSVEGYSEFLIRNLDWIHRHPAQAPDCYGWVSKLAQSSRRAAYPQRPEGNYLGPCPMLLPVMEDDGRVHEVPCAEPIRFDRVRYEEDLNLPVRNDDGTIRKIYEPTCPNCGTAGSLRWWANQMAGHIDTVDKHLTSGPLAMWLNWGLRRGDITASMIRGWKRDGHLTEAGRNDRNQPLYDRNQAEAFARKKWNLPALDEVNA
jgi:hypothetical protein